MRTEMITHLRCRVVVIAAVCLVFVVRAMAETPMYLVLEMFADSIAYYSPTGELKATVPTGSRPGRMVLSADRRFLYVANVSGNSITIIDVAARRRFAEISLGEFHSPNGIDLDRETGNLMVTTSMPDQLLVIDPTKRTVL